MANQPKLFETSQTALLLSELERYRELTDAQQALVRAYIDAHEQCGGRITKTDWIKRAQQEEGISRSRAYEMLQEDPVTIHAAIREALQQTGETAAQYGALALYAAGLKLYEDMVSGERPTYKLTSVELGIMRECVQSLSPVRLIGASVGSDGKTSAAVAGRGEAADLGDQASSVVQQLREQLGNLRGGPEQTDAGSESGDCAGVEAESVQPEGDNGQDDGGSRGSGDQDGSDAIAGEEGDEGGGAGVAIDADAEGSVRHQEGSE